MSLDLNLAFRDMKYPVRHKQFGSFSYVDFFSKFDIRVKCFSHPSQRSKTSVHPVSVFLRMTLHLFPQRGDLNARKSGLVMFSVYSSFLIWVDSYFELCEDTKSTPMKKMMCYACFMHLTQSFHSCSFRRYCSYVTERERIKG